MTEDGGLQLLDVRITLGDALLVELSLSIAPGEVVTLMGPSGSGKSTLLAWMTGTLPGAFTASGRIVSAGLDITETAPEDRRLGLLLQDDLLFPHMSVGQNLLFGCRSGTRSARRKRVRQALADIGLEGYAPRDPATLSGGQRARVALLRTLLAEPRALLLDEPFSKLDADRRDRVRRFVFARARADGLPTLLVTHDEADAEAAGGRIVRLGA